MQLLLVSEKKVSTGEAARAVRAFKGLLLRMRTLMAFQMFQSRKRATAGRANVRPGLVRFRWRDIAVDTSVAIGFRLLGTRTLP